MCLSCEALYINGALCHELGCPDAWQDQTRECKECGCEFIAEDRHQAFCSDQCAYAYYGEPHAFSLDEGDAASR